MPETSIVAPKRHPDVAALLEEAKAAHGGRRFEAAEAACRRALELDGACHEAVHILALMRYQTRRFDEAATLVDRALALAPDDPAYLNTRGLILLAAGDGAAAETAFRQAIDAKPDFALAWSNLARALLRGERTLDAIEALRRAIRADPKSADPHDLLADAFGRLGQPGPRAHHLGLAAHKRHRDREAIGHLRDALRQNAEDPSLWRDLAGALGRLGWFDDAKAAYERALALAPDDAGTLRSLGVLLVLADRPEEAVPILERFLDRRPDDVMGHVAHAQALLIEGEMRAGWAAFEWRLRDEKLTQENLRGRFETPRWDGQPFPGRRLFVHTEQGKGDIIQFIRLLPLARARGGTVVFECERELMPLARTVPGHDEIVEKRFDRDAPYPPHDIHVALMSLPHVLGLDLDTIPAEVPYLSPDPALVEAARQRTAGDGAALRVGLSWAGNPQHPADRLRSLRLDALAPLARIPGVRYYSLQVGAAATQAPPPGLSLAPLPEAASDFAGTAALMMNLDLVISVDTAIAHLAGALGRPTWTLLAFAPDWRWLRRRTDSPWYPSMRLYRQQRFADWAAPIGRIAADLAALAARRSVEAGDGGLE